MTLPTTYDWQLTAGAPAWLRTAVEADRDPWTGAYSFVYPLGANEVVKLVNESGALGFLRLCHTKPWSPHLPRVYEILDGCSVLERVTQQEYTPVRMERLCNRGTAMEPYSIPYRQIVTRLVEDIDCNVALSVAAVTELAERFAPFSPSLAECLRQLCPVLSEHRWIADLGSTDNWMKRPDGRVVLSDPCHHVDSFADDLI